MKPLYILAFTILTQLPSQAQKYDQQWPFGWGITQEWSFGISMLDFNSDEVDLYYRGPANRPSRLSAAGSFVCDKNGQFLLGTDNCRIFDSNMITIEGGDNMNPGETTDVHCEEFDYPAFYSSIILPEVSNDSTFYVVHQDTPIDVAQQAIIGKKLYLSIVVQRNVLRQS